MVEHRGTPARNAPGGGPDIVIRDPANRRLILVEVTRRRGSAADGEFPAIIDHLDDAIAAGGYDDYGLIYVSPGTSARMRSSIADMGNRFRERDDANRPTSDSAGATYSNDLDGRLTGHPGQTLVWDALGRLVQVKDPITSANISTYTYDALDRLLTVNNGSGLTKFRYVGVTTQIAQARDLANAVLYNVGTSYAGSARMDFGPGGTNQRFYGTNGHGDLTWTGSSTGTVSATLRSDPWGVPGTYSGGSLPSFRFQGSWYDTSAALSWVVNRWYAPSAGRFISEDSLLGSPGEPASRHLYIYLEGSPLNGTDPDGQKGAWFMVRQRTDRDDPLGFLGLAWQGICALIGKTLAGAALCLSVEAGLMFANASETRVITHARIFAKYLYGRAIRITETKGFEIHAKLKGGGTIVYNIWEKYASRTSEFHFASREAQDSCRDEHWLGAIWFDRRQCVYRSTSRMDLKLRPWYGSLVSSCYSSTWPSYTTRETNPQSGWPERECRFLV